MIFVGSMTRPTVLDCFCFVSPPPWKGGAPARFLVWLARAALLGFVVEDVDLLPCAAAPAPPQGEAQEDQQERGG